MFPPITRIRIPTLPVWAVFSILTISIIFSAVWYLWPAPWEFSLDDTYIHFVYAENLAKTGRWYFNYPGEGAVGTTSPLWVVLLASGYTAGVPLHIMAKGLGIVSLTILSCGLYLLFKPALQPAAAFFGALLVALSGNMLWFALSGMETVAFLSLGILALLVYRGERWVLLGILLGLVILMRPEGIALAAAVGIIDVWQKRRISRDIQKRAIICAFICVPWYAYLYYRTGYLLPNSAVAKMDSFRIGIQVISEKYPLLEPLSGLYPLVYFGFLLGFLIEFVLGGMAFPGPRLTFESVAGIAGFSLSIWAVLLLLAVVTPLLIFASERILSIKSWPDWIKKNEFKVLLAFSVWVILHNIGLSVGLPSIGTGGRYAAIVVTALWMLVVIGLVQSRVRGFYLLVFTCAVAAAALFNFLYWNEVHDSNLAYMDNVRIKTANFICEDFSEDEKCAAIDIGVYRYYCDRPVVDLGGLVNPNIIDWYRAGDFNGYLAEAGAACMVLPGIGGNAKSEVYDYFKLMHFDESGIFEAQPVKVYELEHDRWLTGSLPTNNYPAGLTVYRLVSANFQDEQALIEKQ